MNNISIKLVTDNISELFEKILSLLMSVYISTDGKYPAMEWLSPEEKPKINSQDFESDFREKYGDFLRWRLSKEIDELFLAYYNGELAGCVGLNYKLEGKKIPWIPSEFMDNQYGFIELLVVHPNFQGKGIGKKLFLIALKRLKDLKKRGCVVTFPNLDAVTFYESLGGVKVKEYDGYLLYCF